jgi:methylthioribose-1-phosphate isomerase
VNVDGKPYRTIWPAADGGAVEIIDQAALPHAFVVRRLQTAAEVAHAIKAMLVRGAPARWPRRAAPCWPPARRR